MFSRYKQCRSLTLIRRSLSSIKPVTSKRYNSNTVTTKAAVVLNELKLSNETTIAFTREGNLDSDVVIVACHGGPGSHNDFKYIADSLNETMKEPYQFLRFDLPGYGKSSRAKSSVASAKYYSTSIIETLNQLGISNKRIIVIGHSLGGHIALDMSKRASLTGIILLASVCCRPHRALGNDSGYKISKFLGMNINHSIFGGLVKSYLEFYYKKILGFPKNANKDEIAWTQERVAYLDFNEFTSQVKSLQCPVLFAYALDDKLLEPPIFHELANYIVSNKNIKNNKIIEYPDGGHNIQKTKAANLGIEIKNWITNIL